MDEKGLSVHPLRPVLSQVRAHLTYDVFSLDNLPFILYDKLIQQKGRALAADEEERLTFGIVNITPGKPGLLMTPFGGCESRNSQTFFYFPLSKMGSLPRDSQASAPLLRFSPPRRRRGFLWRN